jgi:butyrate kinase
MASVLRGRIDAIVLTGGLATSSMLVAWITERVSFLGPVLVYPGEDEMRTLAAETLAVLQNISLPLDY